MSTISGRLYMQACSNVDGDRPRRSGNWSGTGSYPAKPCGKLSTSLEIVTCNSHHHVARTSRSTVMHRIETIVDKL